jgi:hypothetical protein
MDGLCRRLSGLRMRPLLLIGVFVALLLPAGCGSAAHQPHPVAKPRVRAANALTEGQVLSVRLGTPMRTVLRRLGPPSGTGPQKLGRDRCRYWQITGQPPSKALWRLCFRSGRLDIVSTYLI